MITYEWVRNDLTIVYLDGKRVGKIELHNKSYIYFPKDSTLCGERYPTLELCKKSLEDED